MTDYTEKDVYALLTDRFQPIYADLVVALGKKPTQLVFQLEAAFVHLATANKHPDQAQGNINKAYGHLQRATLDAAKILWHLYKTRLEHIAEDEQLRKFCINCSEKELMQHYRDAEALAREARRLEIQSVGINPENSLDAYYSAALKLRETLELIDPDKFHSFQRFRVVLKYREHGLAFVLGILASIVASLLYNLLAG
ncbi:hypothetical protein [Endothiovibrio diazotrophicus]